MVPSLDLKRLEKSVKGTGHYKLVQRGPTLYGVGGGGGVIEDNTYLMNFITDKILFALKFEFTEKFQLARVSIARLNQEM